VERACRLIEAAEEPPRLEALAGELGASASHLHRTFRRITGVTPRAYAAARRARAARAALADGKAVTDAVYDAGYGASSRFYADAPAILGMAPSRYRRGAAGERVKLAIAPCAVGHVLVAATERGVCAIELGDSPRALEAAVRARFPAAERVERDPHLTAWLKAVVAHIEAPRTPLALPLDLRGTAFQRRVWEALRRTRPGATVSYAELAHAIGAPGAARAVGRACAANTLALAIPCHRVTRADGARGGYRWGARRKEKLLEREKA
jgi:AraC family transcriptional regulator of adaptative response/methylated-DNA-[protein]-cysteine methyltransferase